MLLMDNILSEMQAIINKYIDPKYDSQDTLTENDPNETDTIGQLTHKLNCTCIQMWENQEFLYAVRKMTPKEFIKKYGNDLNNLHRMIKRCCDLNNQRSMLMDAIDKKAVKIAKGNK